MAFMEPEVIKGRGWEVETSDGTFYVPGMVLEEKASKRTLMQYAPEPISPRATVHRWREVTGYFARLSAPGYLDATDWEFFRTAREAEAWEAEQESDDGDDDGEDDGEDDGDGDDWDDDGPDEEDITANDPDGPFYYAGREVARDRAALKRWMQREQYHPNVWWISDHGNPHLITDL